MQAATTTTATTTKKKEGLVEIQFVTECPTKPCHIFYSDIFGIIEVVCKNPCHNNNTSKNLRVTSPQSRTQTKDINPVSSEVNYLDY
jgi:hypothetical protein